MNRLLSILTAAALLAAAGCAGGTIRVYDGSSAAPVVVQVSGSSVDESPDEPSVCLFAWHGRHVMGEFDALRDAGQFRSLLLLTDGHLEPNGCGVLLSIRQEGTRYKIGRSHVDVYSAYGGERLLRADADWSTHLGLQTLARYLKTELQPGRALRTKLDGLRSTRPLIGADEVARLAESDPLTWETLISAAANPNEKSQFEALRQKTSAAVAEAATGEEDSADEEDAKDPAAGDSAGAAEPVRSDLDVLPGARARDPHAYAVVIGVEHYREKLPNAEFSAADAKLAAEYFKRVLGVPEENLALMTEERAAKSDFEKYFERWLPNRVEAGDTVYVYYSGHGAPNPAKGDAYLVPYDGDPTYIEQTGYSVKRLFDQLAKLPAKQVYVAMDSCLSGAGGRSVIAKSARPLVNVALDAVPAKLTMISASAGDQISNGDEKQGHGLFTYYFLKGLKEKGPDLRAVYDYLRPEVARAARREYNADQEPQWRQGR